MKLAKALAHPVRQHALLILNERVASPSEIAADLELPIANVAYHIRCLLQLGCIEEVEARPVRGSIEHRYRALRRPLLMPTEWEALPANARNAFTQGWLRDVVRDMTEAIEADVFDRRTDRHMSRTPLQLDEQAWAEITARSLEFLEWALEKQAEAAVRLREGKSGGEPVRSVLTILHHEAAPESAT